jgi:membrane fusion protein (multidrug efflux system)
MNGKHLVAMALVAGALVLLGGCRPGGAEGASVPVVPASAVSEERSSTAVRVITLQRETFRSYLELTGTVKARNQIMITVEEGGTIKEIVADKGDAVKAGEVLARLENRLLDAAYRQAEASLRQAQLDHNSKKVLFEKKAISENEYLLSLYGLDAAQAAYEVAKVRREKLAVVAPIEGYVDERYYDLGAYATPLTPMFQLVDNEVMRVRTGVAERFRAEIDLGTPVEVTFDAYPDLKLQASVDFVSRSIDPRSRTFRIEMEIPNAGDALAPEMVANVKILRRVYEDAIVIPLDALVETEAGWCVFVEQGGVARKTPITQLAVYEDRVLVEGLSAAQRLVVAGQQELADGDPVLISST